MKHKIISFMFSTADGGAETLVKDYSLLLDKNHFTPIIVVFRDFANTANHKTLKDNNIKIISIFKHNSIPFKIIQKLNYWWYVPFKLKRILIKENTDILHVHLSFLRYVDRISSALKNINIFYTCHNEPRIHLGRKDEYKAAQHLLQNNNLQIIALHDDMRKEINEMFGIDNTVVIRNGIDFNRFRNIPDSKDDIRQELGIPATAFVIGHVGRFHQQKNHAFLIDIFAEICKRRDDAFLLLVGDGTLKDRVESKLNKLEMNGKYLILSHRSDIPQLMKAMDVFIFPSLYEGLGIVLIEAQVTGLRCIISDFVPKEAFQSELAVPLSLSESVDKWCDTILDDSIRGTIHGNIEDYDMNKEIKRLEELYLGELDA